MWAKQKGFTIVELLIVIVVIGILAAITIVAYSGIRNRANDSAVQSDLLGAAKKINLYKIDNGDVFPTTTFPNSMQIEISKNSYTLGRNNFYYCASAAGDSFALSAESLSGNDYAYSTNSGGVYKVSGGISGGSNCLLAGNTNPPTPSSAWFQAYNWNSATSTGNWSTWVAN